MSVKFKADHADLLEKALDGLGLARDWNVAKTFCRLANGIELDLRTGRASIQPQQQGKLNELKRAYATEAIKLLAQKNRWVVSKTTATKGQFIRTYQ
jgi:hypothetical protein